jgi:uroporphyrin-III C-methyltransferase/precorrin-2 dehydrogenase/sirohydrochlorin ferrochelatase
MDWFPIFLDLRGADCMVVGGGRVALRKTGQLAAAGARVTVVAPRRIGAFGALASDLKNGGRVTFIDSVFTPEMAAGRRVVFAASDDPEVNRAAASAAARHGALVNVVDDPGHSTFISPAIIEREGLTIAIGSDGIAPILVREVASQIEALIPHRLGNLARLLGRWRMTVRQSIRSPELRRSFWQRVIRGPIARRALAGRDEDAARLMARELERAAAGDVSPRGEVQIVGAGPGDPELLTLRALKLMNDCDVVLYDRLVPSAILRLVRRDAERIDVGKPRGAGGGRQERINELMIDLARAGKRVLRLKGGDPLIFGRGGEEIEALASAGVPFEIVPGITAALGCASSAAIPLTHRKFSHTVVFVTGHPGDPADSLDWARLAAPGQTVVFYMALGTTDAIAARLVDHGLDPATPAALISHGTMPGECVITGTLATLPGTVAARRPPAPALLIVGDVVAVREGLLASASATDTGHPAGDGDNFSAPAPWLTWLDNPSTV